MPLEPPTDVVVIGGGPAGSATAWHLARAGLSVLILERQPFPRFHIGESLTGTAGDFVREFGLSDDMDRLDFPVKPGVKVIGHGAAREFYVPVLRPTWQVRRAEFDQLLLDRAQQAGARHRIATVQHLLCDGERVVGVAFRDDQRGPGEVRCRVVVNASGQSMVLAKQGVAGKPEVDDFGRQVAIHSQFERVARDDGEAGNATVIFYDAPLHWAWMIPLSRDLVSIGVVLPARSFKSHGDSPERVLAWGLDNLNPDLTRRTRDARRTEPVRACRDYSYRVNPFVGEGWLCVGDSHRFTDPIFSFGVSFALTAARRAADAITAAISGGDEQAEFAHYAAYCTRGHDAASDLIRYFWAFPAFFSYMTRGKHGQDIIRLLAGDCFEDPPLDASRVMRESLERVGPPGAAGPDGPDQRGARA